MNQFCCLFVQIAQIVKKKKSPFALINVCISVISLCKNTIREDVSGTMVWSNGVNNPCPGVTHVKAHSRFTHKICVGVVVMTEWKPQSGRLSGGEINRLWNALVKIRATKSQLREAESSEVSEGFSPSALKKKNENCNSSAVMSHNERPQTNACSPSSHGCCLTLQNGPNPPQNESVKPTRSCYLRWFAHRIRWGSHIVTARLFYIHQDCTAKYKTFLQKSFNHWLVKKKIK